MWIGVLFWIDPLHKKVDTRGGKRDAPRVPILQKGDSSCHKEFVISLLLNALFDLRCNVFLFFHVLLHDFVEGHACIK